MKKLLLISNSYHQDGEYLQHCVPEIKFFLGHKMMNKDCQVAFIPYAAAEKGWDGYAERAKEAFRKMGFQLVSVHTFEKPQDCLLDPSTKAIFVGGGNTFRLLKTLQDKGLLNLIKGLVEKKGIQYIGSSAGANLACPTIKTTNDMPIVAPRNLDALNLVKYQINPHFVPGRLMKKHMGETREKRIEEFHEENDLDVVGLKEGNYIRVNEDESLLMGDGDAVLFSKGKQERYWLCGSYFPA